jgi:hypothetical protein
VNRGSLYRDYFAPFQPDFVILKGAPIFFGYRRDLARLSTTSIWDEGFDDRPVVANSKIVIG